MTPMPQAADAVPAAPRSRGRPRKVDDARRRHICVLVSIGLDLDQAAYHAGCSYPTIRRETLRHPEFGHRLRQALKLKAEVQSLRGSSAEFDRNLTELRQKLCTQPAHSADVPATATTKPAWSYPSVQNS